MARPAIGIRPAPRSAGVCLCLGADVVEARTVDGERSIPKPLTDPETGKAVPGNPVAFVATEPLVALAIATYRTAIELVRAHADTLRTTADAAPVFVVEGLVPARRSATARGRVLEAHLAQAINQGAVAERLINAGHDVLFVPSDDYDKRDPDWYPDCLNGPLPRDWGGRKGADRSVQRAAYAIAQAGLAARHIRT